MKKIPENENLNKRVNIAEKNLNFNKLQKDLLLIELAQLRSLIARVSNRKHIKILTPKKMLNRLPIALAQVKTGNTCENVLNDIRQIIYSL